MLEEKFEALFRLYFKEDPGARMFAVSMMRLIPLVAAILFTIILGWMLQATHRTLSTYFHWG